MDKLISPLSPILDNSDLIALAPYAKHLGKAPKKAQRSQPTGQHQRQVKGHGMEMMELRQYQIHDEFRHIDWRVTARTGVPHTRIYAQENEHKRLLMLDISGVGYFGTQHTFISTRMAQVASLIAWRTQIQHDSLGYCLSFGDQIHQRSYTHNKKLFSLLISHLADATHIQHRAVPSTLEPWNALYKTSSIKQQNVIILSDRLTLSTADLKSIAQLAKHNYLHWIKITDDNAQRLPSGQYLMEDTNGLKWLSVSQMKVKAQLEAQNALFKKQLNELGAHVHQYDLHESPVDIARHLLTIGAIH
ncbi:DUF58 domain-containing protein [Marinomonas algicola]|uniref:DUF58 domain-containing protein n=1 Tax=Marinomonas algicola TaxID=2773454 RepID=UPI00174DBDCE|nr:DUF58 domain-containing protein [Marinomonas algicola]